MKKKTLRAENIIPILLILSPYSFVFAKSLSLGYIVILLLTFVHLFNKKSNFGKFNFENLLFICGLILISLFTLTYTPLSPVNNTILRTFQMIVWALFLGSVTVINIDYNYLLRNIIKISIIASLYAIIQVLLNSLINFKAPNIVNFGLIAPTTLDLRTLVSFRPASFFEEPSYLASYLLVSIAILLFDEIKMINKNKILCLLTLTMVLTTSSSGIYIMTLLYLYRFILKKFNVKKLVFFILIIIFSSIVIKYSGEILANFGQFGLTIEKSINKYKYYESSTRIGNSYNYLTYLEGIHKFTGLGIGNEFLALQNIITYINSITRLILQTGYIGLFLLFSFIFYLYIKSNNNFQKVIIVIYILKSFTGGTLLTLTGMYFLSIYFISRKENYE